MIFAFWRAELCLVGAYLFGALSALPFALQAREVDVTPEFLYALPYVMTILVLVLVSFLTFLIFLKLPGGDPARLRLNFSKLFSPSRVIDRCRRRFSGDGLRLRHSP